MERFRRLQQLPSLADARDGNLTGTGGARMQTPGQMLRIAEQLNALMGGEDRRPGRQGA